MVKGMRQAARVVAIMALGAAAHAASDAQVPSTLERVEITGSALRRLDAESAVPLTVLRIDDLRREGIVSVEQVLQRLAVNQSSLTTSQAVGLGTGGASFANLRGIGEDKTLVLLNGRRLANNAVDSAAVDLNMIPFAALERVEVLRDGASALYGTDAIGGVVNFITRRGDTGTVLSLDAIRPDAPGADGQGLSAAIGQGDLERDGYSFTGSLEYRKTERLKARQRGFAASAFKPGRGIDRTSSITTPANYTQRQPGGDFSANPSFAGCAPVGEGGSIDTGSGRPLCRYDPTPFVDLLPEVERAALFGRAAFKLDAGTTASVEYFLTRNLVSTVVGPGTAFGLGMDASSPFFPGNGVTPAPTNFAIDPALPIELDWRTAAVGGRAQRNDNRAQRLVVELEGLAGAWDWRVGASYNESRLTDPLTNGWTNDAAIAAGVADGVLNPFGPQTAAGAATLDAAALRGNVRRAKGKMAAVDARLGRELGDWFSAGRPAALALGAEFRKESFRDDINVPVVAQSFAIGFDLGANPNPDAAGKRHVSAFYGELGVPLAATLDATLAVRHDRYSDFGSTTNPKLALRFQPVPQFLARATYSTGFRAPSLYELYSPRFLSFSLGVYDDPLLCPGGMPVAGADPLTACGQNFLAQLGGNRELEPEKARNFTLGFVFEPTRQLRLGLDFWFIHLRNAIGEFPEAAIFGDPERYADRFRRNADGSLDPFADDPGFFVAVQDNLGKVRTSGIDVSGQWRRPVVGLGAIVLGASGTYVTRYDYQNEPGGEFTNNVGRHADVRPIFRWKHVATVAFEAPAWSLGLTHRYQSGYEDENFVAPGFERDVGAWSVWDLFGRWSPTAALTLAAGVRNLFDTDPRFSNQGATFQSGYDPRFSDPTGRAFFAGLDWRFN